MNETQLKQLRLELSVKAKNGIDFITAASIIWLGITYIWTLEGNSYNLSVFTFIVGSLMLPLAFAFSKVYKTQWKLEHNPLQPLGLWLNFAQLFYFPILILVLIKFPDYFLMTYAVITGAHFMPYAWFYDEIAYAIAAGIIGLGSLLLALYFPENMYLVGVLITTCLILMGLTLGVSVRKKSENFEPEKKIA